MHKGKLTIWKDDRGFGFIQLDDTEKIFTKIGSQFNSYVLADFGDPTGKETPIFNCPSIIIGTRQDGRLRGENVITVDYQQNSIKDAIIKCLTDDSFRLKCKDVINPYGSGNSGKIIADFLSEVNLGYKTLNKQITY